METVLPPPERGRKGKGRLRKISEDGTGRGIRVTEGHGGTIEK